MPFQITISIDPSKKIRQFIERRKKKKENHENEESYKSDGTDKCLQSRSSDNDTETLTVYRSANYDHSCFLSSQSDSDKEGTSIVTATGNLVKSEGLIDKSDELQVSTYVKSSESEPKLGFPNIIKKIFMANKKEDQSQIEMVETEPNPVCGNAIDPFNILYENESSLEALVGQAFSLNTTVTIQSVEDDGKPNLILSGSIPFQVTTKQGVVTKKVRVKGKLYSPKTDEGSQTIRDENSMVSMYTAKKSINSSTQSLMKMRINENFKLDFSTLKKVSWLTSKIYTQEEYKYHSIWLKGYIPLHKQYSNHDDNERLKYISDIDDEESSMNIIAQGHLTSSSSSIYPTRDHRKMQLPVTSITIARSKTRLIRFTDGTDFTEKVGRNVITLAAPEGILYLPGEKTEEKYDVSSFEKTPSVSLINCEDNIFTRNCYQMAKDENNYALSQSGNESKRSGRERSRRLSLELKNAEPVTYYPPGNYSHIYKDRYNPLTWIYQNFDKTTRFVKEFSC